jgi:uncharacterized membrane protein
VRTYYNRIAGQNLERLAALSDGVFAIAMTLLVLDLRVPAAEAIHSEQALWDALLKLAPRVFPYFMSFLTLGIFWVGQQSQLNHLARSNRNLTWLHLAFLLGVSLTPFSTALLGEFITYRIALVTYWFNIFLLGTVLFISLRYAHSAGLFKDEMTAEVRTALEQRIVIAQALYAFGAILCIFNTYWSIAFILLVQINYAIAPRIRPLDRL